MRGPIGAMVPASSSSSLPRWKYDAGPHDSQPALGTRLLEAIEGDAAQDQHILDSLLPELRGLAHGDGELLRIVSFCADHQSALGGRYSDAVGQFCMCAIELLLESGHELLQGVRDGLRLLEGVLLIRMVEPHHRTRLMHVIQVLLRKRVLPKQAVGRLECALMSLADPAVRRLCAPEKLRQRFGGFIERQLADVFESVRPKKAHNDQCRSVFELFDEVIFDTFGIHGKRFGSAVNGFELQSSDLDIVVLLPANVQHDLVARARSDRERDSANTSDWSFLKLFPTLRVASVAASRKLATELHRQGLNVTEVVENARVPIVKCKHIAEPPQGEEFQSKAEEFEIDISFCNEVAYHNSQLLRAYADFDSRAVVVVVLVKLWAKRRKINSPFEGTLSSYAYALMVIHYLQTCGVLPNLQCLSPAACAKLGVTCTERIISGGHNVWFFDPAQLEERGLTNEEVWGCNSPDLGILDLLYGFFRYFALELNAYAHVVSIRLPDGRPLKVDYFEAEAEKESSDSEVCDNDDEVVLPIRENEEVETHELAAEHNGEDEEIVVFSGNDGELLPVREEGDSSTGSNSDAEHNDSFGAAHREGRGAGGVGAEGGRLGLPEAPTGGSRSDDADVVLCKQEASDAAAKERPVSRRIKQRAQSTLRKRQTLCIDDPMERLRTLSVSFSGHDSICVEFRRAVSILKKMAEDTVDRLFESRHPRSMPPKWSSAAPPERDFSPIPVHYFSRSDEGGDWQASVQVSHPIRRRNIGQIIGIQGSKIKTLKQEAGVDEMYVKQASTGTGDEAVQIRGAPDCVMKALELIEEVTSGKRKPHGAAGGPPSRSFPAGGAEKAHAATGPATGAAEAHDQRWSPSTGCSPPGDAADIGHGSDAGDTGATPAGIPRRWGRRHSEASAAASEAAASSSWPPSVPAPTSAVPSPPVLESSTVDTTVPSEPKPELGSFRNILNGYTLPLPDLENEEFYLTNGGSGQPCSPRRGAPPNEQPREPYPQKRSNKTGANKIVAKRMQEQPTT